MSNNVTLNKLARSSENLLTAFQNFGVSVETACVAVSSFASCIPPVTEYEIALVKLNPNLSWFDKFFIIIKMKKQMKYQELQKQKYEKRRKK